MNTTSTTVDQSSTPDRPLRQPRTPRPPVTSDLQHWHFPTAHQNTLPNGTRVLYFHLPGQHVVACDLVLPIGLGAEPAGLEGVALLAQRVADEGSRDLPSGALTEALENLGAAVSGSVGRRATTLSLDAPASRFARAIELFGQVVTQPRFDAEDVDRHRNIRLSEIEQAKLHGPAVANHALRHLVWPSDSRWQRATGGSASTVSAIGPADLHDFVNRWWRPRPGDAAATLVLAGDLDDPQPALEHAFAPWTAAEDPSDPFEVPSPRAGTPVVHLVDRPDAVQTELRIAGTGIGRREPHWPALRVGACAMGGSFLSRLNHTIREDRGFTYGIGMGLSPDGPIGTWQIGASVGVEVAAEALRLSLDLLDVSARPFTGREVAEAIGQLADVAPLQYQSAEDVVGQAGALVVDGLDTGYLDQHLQQVRAVTAEQASQSFASIINPDAAHLVLVGPATTLEPQLRSAGFEVDQLVL